MQCLYISSHIKSAAIDSYAALLSLYSFPKLLNVYCILIKTFIAIRLVLSLVPYVKALIVVYHLDRMMIGVLPI